MIQINVILKHIMLPITIQWVPDKHMELVSLIFIYSPFSMRSVGIVWNTKTFVYIYTFAPYMLCSVFEPLV